MERVYQELDVAKTDIVNLKADCRIKAELSESLKRAHSEQLAKACELGLKIEKQGYELNERAKEIYSVKQMYEEIKSRLNEKEGIIKILSSANAKLRVDCIHKLKKLEEEKSELAKTLDVVNGKNIDQEQKIHAFKEEIEGLKGILLISQRKCSEAEEKARAPNELRKTDRLISLEEESKQVKDELKWKKEQFSHFEDAHEKLREQFFASKKEWELEKSTLVDELCSVQASLESQTRISEDLQNRLNMCNQGLSHEESQRKYAEIQVSRSKTCLESVFSQCPEVRLKIGNLTPHRDEEIADLQNSLGKKGILYKEMEYKVGKLEQENQDVHASLKELHEAQICGGGNYSSFNNLEHKLRNLEQLHSGCSANLDDCISELKSKHMAIEDLEMELRLQNEESSLMLLVLKSEFSAAISKLNAEKASMGSREKEREHISLLLKDLELKDRALRKSQMTIKEESAKSASFSKRVEEMLEESLTYQLRSKDQALKMETDFKEKPREENHGKCSEITKLTNQIRTNLNDSDVTIHKLEDERRELQEEILKLSSERESLMGFLWDLDDKIGKYSTEEMQLRGMLENIVDTCGTEIGSTAFAQSDSEKTFKFDKADLGEKQLGVKGTHQLETNLRASYSTVDKLEDEKRNLQHENTELTSEREKLLGFLGDVGDNICEFSSQDMQLMGMLERIVKACNTDSVGMALEGNAEKEGVDVCFPPAVKKYVAIPYARSPFKELNH